MRRSHLHIHRALALLAAGFGLSACTSGSGVNVAPQGVGGDGDGGADGTADVRVLHLSPTAPAVDVFVDGQAEAAIRDLSFRTGTDYVALPAGEHRFDVAPAGGSLEDSVLTIGPRDLPAGIRASAVAYGNVAAIQALVLIDDTADIGDSETRLRIAHVANGVAPVDIVATIFDSELPIADELEYGEALDALDVPAGEAIVVALDTNDDDEADFTFDVPALPAGELVNVFAVTESNRLSLVAQLPDGQVLTLDPREDAAIGDARVRAVHLAAGVGPVDVYVNGVPEPAVEDLAFGESTPFLDLLADQYVFDVTPANTSIEESVLRIGPVNIVAGDAPIIVGYRDGDDLGVLVLETDADQGAIAPNDVRVRVGHAASGVGTVDVRIGCDAERAFLIGNDLELGEAGRSIDASAGVPYTATIDVDLDGTGDLAFETPALPAGVRIDVLAAIDEAGEVFLLALLPDGGTLRIDVLQP